ncbi:metalloregulator ArsR/SmtB family transcription factor [Candidatus Oleimmundimicrobium sp.]|uniref:ArsR/SmtB family transcription factor n=1 Tax=Candidatus Oleimmundimicrobium sp. TaxID=3060597 RepID=UPI00271A49B2|nr:metalloregulator ArsR/SmtB family transcription factor [Candidatus Oleimmundimicrobium sp.]MDO8885617.1 metalloregulator ArsR/SmtB family transcription factor [Candidatus Oleimmundimicrobium sp.]
MEDLQVGCGIKTKKLKELAEYLKIISDENRLKILCFLKHGEHCVCKINEVLNLPQNLTSHHLKILREADFVIARREGRWIHYRLNNKKIRYLMELCQKNILGGKSGD